MPHSSLDIFFRDDSSASTRVDKFPVDASVQGVSALMLPGPCRTSTWFNINDSSTREGGKIKILDRDLGSTHQVQPRNHSEPEVVSHC